MLWASVLIILPGPLLPARRQVKAKCHEFISRELAFVVITVKVAEPGPTHFY